VKAAIGWAVALSAVALAGTSGTLAAPAPPPRYHLEAVHGRGTLTTLRARMKAEELDQVLRLNRVDAEHLARLDTLVVPDRTEGFVAPSPFPDHLPAADSLPKLVIVALRVQAFALVDSGRCIFWGPVSSGAATSPTPPGAYSVNWKLPVHVSTVDESWVMRWCVNLDNREGTALHQYDLPGLPGSHCCVRLLEEDAHRLYDWVDEWRLAKDGRTVLAPGTPVWIAGDYDYDAPPPWRRFHVDPAADRLSPGELEPALSAVPR
jgi:lipoprotein-anchoring transpeptidase ErfK/SrfK